jgi:hypothetical protein
MNSPLDEICCARIPAASLAGLAEIRCADGVEVIADGETCWLRWPAGSDDVLRLVLPLPGVVLYVQRAGAWYTFGSRLPTDGPPRQLAVQPLDRLLTPARVEPESLPASTLQPIPLRLLRDDTRHPTSALRCPLSRFAAWAENATTVRLTSLRAALARDVVLLMGEHLPLLLDAVRFWGKRVLVPLGYRPEPSLPESALVSVLHLAGDEIAILNEASNEASVDVLPAAVLKPLNRASVRLACRERTS